jgi:hypothetical protein
MQYRKEILSLAAILLLIASPLVIRAQQPAPSDNPQVIALATRRPFAELLPDNLAGVKATGEIKQYSAADLAQLIADKAAVYQEYTVARAASRQYGATRVDLFETQTPLAAFGLLTYTSGEGGSKTVVESIGSGGARVDGAVVFWKENYFVRLTMPNTALARAVAETITPIDAPARPRLLEDLPQTSIIAGSQRYFLGPESLNAYVERGRDMFGFAGDAEAVMAEYQTGARKPAGGATSQNNASAHSSQSPPMKLVIIEYKTPQFAYYAMERATNYVNSLSEDEQNRIIVKREGNYIVEAVSFQDREATQALVDSIKYPYSVKWLHDPRRPLRDPFRMQKAAQMLISTFGLLGVLLLVVFVGGSIFGTAVFLKRRRRQQEVFSDAGGMVRLDLDPFEATLLGLPPKRE